MTEHKTGVLSEMRDMEQYIDISLELTGFQPVSTEQRNGIKQYYDFAQAMMAPLLDFEIPGENL